MSKSRMERRSDKVERTLVRLKYSLLADEEIDDRREAREKALSMGDEYTINVPQLLAGVEQAVNNEADDFI